ncbi:MAG TPA: hypothetical protein VF679_07965 [Pedobacter sp.]
MFGGDMFGMNKDKAQGQVSELAERLKSHAGLSDEQAKKTLETIKNFIVEKYPMLGGAVDNMFGGK